MKKLCVLVSMALLSVAVFARPHCGPGFPHGGFRHHGYRHSFWGSGGRNFWPGFAGGLVAGAICNSYYRRPVVVTPPITTVVNPYPATVITTPVVTTTVVPTQPVYVPPQRVWVAGHYETRYYPNGQPYQVWIEGYWQ